MWIHESFTIIQKVFFVEFYYYGKLEPNMRGIRKNFIENK
jgi:hypothetical protein